MKWSQIVIGLLNNNLVSTIFWQFSQEAKNPVTYTQTIWPQYSLELRKGHQDYGSRLEK